MRRFLVDCLKVEGFNKVEIFQDKTKIRANGDFHLPEVLKEFKTPEEAKAYAQGIKWAVLYYGGELKHYTKDFEID